MKKAFTMIELIFVIVILGILAGVAIPKLAVTRDDAQITKGRADLSTIRSAIVLTRNQDMMRGKGAKFPDTLDKAALNKSGEPLFSEVLDNPIRSKESAGGWLKTGETTYTFQVSSKTKVTFTYYPVINGDHKAGTFDCNHEEQGCKDLAE